MIKVSNQKQHNTNNDSTQYVNKEKILIEKIIEDDKTLKWIYNSIILLGSIGFLCVGISSYLNYNIVFFLKSEQIIFYPQGITMVFYGTCGFIISLNQIKILLNKIGEGYNEFNKDKKIMKIYRKGFRGKESDINIICPLTDIDAIRIEHKNNIFINKQNIFVCIKGKNDLPILQLSKPLKLQELEKRAGRIAAFLNVPIKGT